MVPKSAAPWYTHWSSSFTVQPFAACYRYTLINPHHFNSHGLVFCDVQEGLSRTIPSTVQSAYLHFTLQNGLSKDPKRPTFWLVWGVLVGPPKPWDRGGLEGIFGTNFIISPLDPTPEYPQNSRNWSVVQGFKHGGNFSPLLELNTRGVRVQGLEGGQGET